MYRKTITEGHTQTRQNILVLLVDQTYLHRLLTVYMTCPPWRQNNSQETPKKEKRNQIRRRIQVNRLATMLDRLFFNNNPKRQLWEGHRTESAMSLYLLACLL